MPAGKWIFDQMKAAESAGDQELANHYSKLTELYDKRLYHQLTIALEDFIRLPRWESTKASIELYENFLMEFESYLNPLKLAQIVIVISKQYTEPAERTKFLESVMERITDRPASILLRCVAGLDYLDMGEFKKVKVLVEEVEEEVEKLVGEDSSVYASYYYLAAKYQKARGTAEGYFKNMMMHLAYISMDGVDIETQRSIAFDLCLAALIGDKVYNFGELLVHPVLNSLETTDSAWIVELLRAFNAGDLENYEAVVSKYKNKMSTQSSLMKNAQLLKEKICILALMQLIFRKPADERTIAFQEVASATKLAESEVELLLMRALSLKLVKGYIDEVRQIVEISWVQPRALDMDQLAMLRQKLGQWSEKSRSLHQEMEREIPEFLA